MFRSPQRFYVDGPYLQVNFRVQSNLERLGKVCICFFYFLVLFMLYICFINNVIFLVLFNDE